MWEESVIKCVEPARRRAASVKVNNGGTCPNRARVVRKPAKVTAVLCNGRCSAGGTVLVSA